MAIVVIAAIIARAKIKRPKEFLTEVIRRSIDAAVFMAKMI